jgi:hypothetical protein
MGQSGELAFNVDDKTLRIYDGMSLGGFELQIRRAVGPNPTLLGGTELYGYYGEVPHEQLISATALCAKVGLTAGTLINEQTNWLKFNLAGRIVFMAKQPIRSGLTRDQLKGLMLVVGNAVIQIQGIAYKVRLIKGAIEDPIQALNYLLGGNVNDPSVAKGSEWNSLFNPITTSLGQASRWANFSNAELGLTVPSVCQELTAGGAAVLRGGTGPLYFTSAAVNSATLNWRPLLELVPQ